MNAAAICFHGADHRCGTSMLCQCCAEYIADKRPDRSVLLLHAEGLKGADYCHGVSESMERIRPYLAERIFDAGEVAANSRVRDNLFVIGGQDAAPSHPLLPDMAEYLIRSLRPCFDLIISDSGSRLENGLPLGVMFASDRIYTVLDQSENSLRRYEWLRPIYEKLVLNMDRFVLNRTSRGSYYSPGYVRERLGIGREQLFTVRTHPCGEDAEVLGESLLRLRAPQGFRKDIGAICGDIEALMDGGRDE